MTAPKSPLVVIGAGGHARVLVSLAKVIGHSVIGICDPILAAAQETIWHGIRVLGDDDSLSRYSPNDLLVVNGVGQLVGENRRRMVYEKIKEYGFAFQTLVHPNAWICDDVRLAEGAQIMAGAVIQPGCVIDCNSIVNTNASVDHDCHIGAHVHIAPGATLCGGVIVKEGAFIGSGSTVVQGIHIGVGAIVGAGTVLTANLADFTRAYGARTTLRAQ